MAPIIYGVKICVLGRQRPFPPVSLQRQVCLFTVAAGVHLRGEPTLFPGWLVYK